MIDSEYSIDNHNSTKINIGTTTKYPEMLKFVPNHLKTQKMCKHAVEKLSFVIKYVLD